MLCPLGRPGAASPCCPSCQPHLGVAYCPSNSEQLAPAGTSLCRMPRAIQSKHKCSHLWHGRG